MWQSLADIAMRGGPWGLVSLCVVAIMRGWLIPLRMHQAVLVEAHKRGDFYERAYELRGVELAERERQLGIVLGLGVPVNGGPTSVPVSRAPSGL